MLVRVDLDAEDDGTAREKVLHGNIHGLFVRQPGNIRTIYINRDDLDDYLDDFKEVLGEDVTAAQALLFVGPALLILLLTSRYLSGENAAVQGFGRL